jgi:multiple antibiotic resistance protein
MLHYALFTALGIGIGFMAVGRFVFLALGITSNDFLIAGGLLLLILSVKDIATGKMLEAEGERGYGAGIVPIGTPLVAGPATLTTLLVLASQYSAVMVLFSFVLNMAIAWVVFHQAERLTKLLGHGGLMAVTKIARLLLAAIAVRVIRLGVTGILSP